MKIFTQPEGEDSHQVHIKQPSLRFEPTLQSVWLYSSTSEYSHVELTLLEVQQIADFFRLYGHRYAPLPAAAGQNVVKFHANHDCKPSGNSQLNKRYSFN